MKKYDLTTQIGITELINSGLLYSPKSNPLPIIARGLPLLDYVFELLKIFFSSPKDQAKAINDIIKNGREQGVDAMEIKAQNVNGLDIDFGKDVDGQIMFGGDNKMTIRVKYK